MRAMTWYDKHAPAPPTPDRQACAQAPRSCRNSGFSYRRNPWRSSLLAAALAATLAIPATAQPTAQTPAAQPPGTQSSGTQPSGTQAPATQQPSPQAATKAPLAGVLIVDDATGDVEPLGGGQEAVRRYTASGRGRADLVATSLAKAEEAIRNLALQHPEIIVVGSSAGAVVERTAPSLPDNRFTLIGAIATGPNIRAVQFRDREVDWLGAWLAGSIAGNGRVGFVGAASSPHRQRALCAAAQGLTAANRAALLFPDMESTIDPKLQARRGAQLARGQIDRGAAVILTPAGAAGAGAMETVRDMGALGVTWHGASAGLFPRNVLAVQARRYDQVIEAALQAVASGSWKAGATSAGLAENAVELRLNDAVAPPVTPEVRAALQGHAGAIASGALQVHDISTDQRCPTPGAG